MVQFQNSCTTFFKIYSDLLKTCVCVCVCTLQKARENSAARMTVKLWPCSWLHFLLMHAWGGSKMLRQQVPEPAAGSAVCSG